MVRLSDEWIGTEQAAALIPSPVREGGLSADTLRRWARMGQTADGRPLPAVKLGRWWYVRKADVLAVLEPFQKAEPVKAPRPGKRRVPAWVAADLRRMGLPTGEGD